MDQVREKKHRLPREAYKGRVTVSFTACIEERRTPFRDSAIVNVFLEKLAVAAHANQCSVLIYCFMPDHLHVMTHGLDDSADAWQMMVAFKQQTGFWFAQQGHLFRWQKDFHDHVIRASEDLGAHIRYVANNPVRRALVADWREYPFIGAIGVELNTVMCDASRL